MSKLFCRLLVTGGLILLSATAVFAAGQAETEAMEGEPERLKVTGVWTGATQEKFEAVLRGFTERTGIQTIYSPAGRDIGTVVGTQLEGGNPPNIAMLPQPGLLVEFARRDALVPLEEIAGDLVDANYAQVWRDLGTVDGTLYGVWFKAANKSLIWYNAEVFDEVGVKPAGTWEELMDIAQTIYDYGLTPFSIGGASAWTLTDWFENIYIRSAGPTMYDKLTAHEISWTHESVKKALSIFKQVAGKSEWLAGGIQGTLEANHPTGIVKPFLSPPKAAMAYGADFSAGAIMNETIAELGVDALFFDFPSIDGSAASVVGGGDVAVLFIDSSGGRKLIRYLCSPEAAEIWAPLGGYTSPNQKVDVSVYPSDIVRQSAKALQEAQVFRFDLSDLQPSQFGSTTGQGLFGLMQDFIRNPDIDDITARLEEQAKRAFETQ
jgi:ABC-type glycerol-3-phosphate transport system substrate-binding protein